MDSTRPWWDELPASFWRRRERFEVQGIKRAEVVGSAILDRAVCTATAAALSGLFLPMLDKRRMGAQLADFEFYQDPRFLEQPGSFFEEPAEVPIRRRTVSPLFQGPAESRSEDLTFEGAFSPMNPRVRDRYLSHRANRISHARHFFHGERPRPTIIALHGFWASPYWINAFMFELPWLFRLGFDVVLPTLPFHGGRRMKGAFFSGHGFVSPQLDQTMEAVAHAVSDIRVVMRELRARGVTTIGITGLSLGGYVSALMASIEPRLAFAIPNVPVVSLVDLLLDWHPLGELFRVAMHQHGLDIAKARRLLAVHSPLSYKPALPKDRLMIVAGAGDRLAPPAQARLLWEHWERPWVYYFPGNHLLHFDRGGYLRMIARFLRRNGVIKDGLFKPDRAA